MEKIFIGVLKAVWLLVPERGERCGRQALAVKILIQSVSTVSNSMLGLKTSYV